MENAKRTIVFFDLDGTLLDRSTDAFPESTLAALDGLRSRGVLICLATGRDMDTHYSVKYTAAIRPDAIIHRNGAKITAGDEPLLLHTMDHGLLRRIYEFSLANDLCVGTTLGGRDYYLHPEVKRASELRHSLTSVRNFVPFEALFEEHTEVYAIDFAGDVPRTQALVEAAFPELTLFPFDSGSGADVCEAGFTKADGIRLVCAHFGVSPADAFAFGDSSNDIPMFEAVGTGVAMGNANDTVKAAADLVTDPLKADGIAKALSRLGLL